MKRILLLFIIYVCFFHSKAQVQPGIFGGLHLSSAMYSVSSTKQSTNFKYGVHAGIECKIPFENRLSFTPAVGYRLMGYKVIFNTPSYPPDILARNNNTSFHEADVDLLFQFDLSKNPKHFFVKAGPSFDFILFGREKFDLLTGQHVERNMKFSVLDSYGRYDAAAVVQLGYETSAGFTVSADYVQGLFSMNNEDNGPTIKNYLIGITFGKLLRPKKK